MIKKTCKKCGKDKPLSAFGLDSKTKDKLKTRCKKCRNDLKKEYYLANKTRIIESNVKYRKKKIEQKIEDFSKNLLEWFDDSLDKKNIKN